MFLDWKIQLEKVQLTRDLKDDTIIYQGIRLLCRNDQGYCDPTTRTQATIVWFPEDTCTTFQVAKIHARMIKFHQKIFIESIPFEDVNPDQLDILVKYEQCFVMNKGKLFTKQYATHHPTTNDESFYISVHLPKNTCQTGGKVKPRHKDSTRLQELSLMSNTYFGAIHYDIH